MKVMKMKTLGLLSAFFLIFPVGMSYAMSDCGKRAFSGSSEEGSNSVQILFQTKSDSIKNKGLVQWIGVIKPSIDDVKQFIRSRQTDSLDPEQFKALFLTYRELFDINDISLYQQGHFLDDITILRQLSSGEIAVLLRKRIDRYHQIVSSGKSYVHIAKNVSALSDISFMFLWDSHRELLEHSDNKTPTGLTREDIKILFPVRVGNSWPAQITEEFSYAFNPEAVESLKPKQKVHLQIDQLSGDSLRSLSSVDILVITNRIFNDNFESNYMKLKKRRKELAEWQKRALDSLNFFSQERRS